MFPRKEPSRRPTYGVVSSKRVENRAQSRRPHSAMTAYTVHTDVHGSVQIDWDVATEAGGDYQDEWSPYVSRSAARDAGRFHNSKVRLHGTIDRHGKATERHSHGVRASPTDTRRVRRSQSHRPTPEPRRPVQWNETPISRPSVRHLPPVMAAHNVASVRQREQRERLEADPRTIYKAIREQRPSRGSMGTRELAEAVERLSWEHETEHVAANAQQDSTTHDVQVRSNLCSGCWSNTHCIYCMFESSGTAGKASGCE